MLDTISLDGNPQSLFFLLAGIFVAWKLFHAVFSPLISRHALPPGPPPLPLLRNLLDIPQEKEWLTFGAWGDKWGEVVYASLPGQPGLVVLNSLRTATDLLDKQSSIYSDRPVIPMGGELVGWRRILGLQRYESGATGSGTDYGTDTLGGGADEAHKFKTFRKLLHQIIGSQGNIKRFDGVLEDETEQFLRRVLDDPERERWRTLQGHIRKTAAGIGLRMIYGYKTNKGEDPFVILADNGMNQFSLSTAPGGFLVNTIPLLQYVPAWFPGAGFKKTAKAWRQTLDDMTDQPYNWVKSQMEKEKAAYSLVSGLLEDSDVTPEREYDIKWAASSMYAGAADTTVSSIYALYLAMVLHPEVMKKAQNEIDTVIGTERLPLLSDRPNLPYVNALVSELLRWHPIAPLAIPHRAVEDNVYEGYFIPKGTLIFPNLWKMAHSTDDYSEPASFNPDRFMGLSPEPDPRAYCWGFGRRICPGRLLADSSVFIACAMALAAFSITKYCEDGTVEEPIVDQTTGIVSHPKLFKCIIRSRPNRATGLVRP